MATLKKMQKRMAKKNNESATLLNMTTFDFANTVEHCFEKHVEWINSINGGIHHWQRQWTWTFDIAIAMFYGKHSVEETCDKAMKFYSQDLEGMTEFVMSVNFMSWFCNSNKGLENWVGFFSDLYYKITYERLPELMSDGDYLQMMRYIN